MLVAQVQLAIADQPDYYGTVYTKEALIAMCADKGKWPDNIEHMWMLGNKLMARVILPAENE